jgi:hypothetical protein
LFAIQIYSALEESKIFDHQTKLINIKPSKIPVLIIKSEKDGIARFVPRIYEGSNAEIIDVTNPKEKDLFREHLYHMVNPHRTTKIIADFIARCEQMHNQQSD